MEVDVEGVAAMCQARSPFCRWIEHDADASSGDTTSRPLDLVSALAPGSIRNPFFWRGSRVRLEDGLRAFTVPGPGTVPVVRNP